MKFRVIVVGCEEAISVSIDLDLDVIDLKRSIKTQFPSLISCTAEDFALYLAKIGNEWLPASHRDVNPLLHGENISIELKKWLRNSYPLPDLMGLRCDKIKFPVAPSAIHFLAYLPEQNAKLRAPPKTVRETRWDEINTALDQFSCRSMKKAVRSCPSPDLIDGDRLFKPITVQFPTTPVPEETVDAMYSSICRVNKSMKFFPEGENEVLDFFVTTVLSDVCSLFDDATCLVNERVTGKRVHSDVTLDAIVQRGAVFIGVAQSSRDWTEAIERCLLGCEALADIHDLDQVFGIVTNGHTWLFYRNCDEYTEEHIAMAFGEINPRLECVRDIADVIYAILLSKGLRTN